MGDEILPRKGKVQNRALRFLLRLKMYSFASAAEVLRKIGGSSQRKKFMNTFTVEKTTDSAYGGVNLLFYQHGGRSVEDVRKTPRKKPVQQSHHKKMFNSPYGRVHSFRNVRKCSVACGAIALCSFGFRSHALGLTRPDWDILNRTFGCFGSARHPLQTKGSQPAPAATSVWGRKSHVVEAQHFLK